MLIFPAIDLRGGKVVRLTQGDYDRMTVYGDDPVKIAEDFAATGAKCLHVVDLDGAKDGSPENRGVIAQLCKRGLFVQVGGGMRTQEDIERTLALGVDRVILGTVAVEDFALVERMVSAHGDKIAVGVDARDGFVATRGWKQVTALDGFDFCIKLTDAGVSTVIYTDIARDGLLGGANLAAYERLQGIQGLRVIASGGIADETEIAALRTLGVYGAIVGKALYTGRLDLAEALHVAREGETEC
ncbi:MAG: 1-(5-phosphoribosyl)-5-[(5-phosphoribosylamino)methylideneamino]imidazole-4-carboxamide isomerase [Eubacteriales bacterium]|nr:1-(5-phosphoribosyl)-5-[(5-phosphoribosylamino)methylideneamino]imidazole-4-carboxamide isomerase [Eubacteriales bacterium]